jgi:hypothetical protein
VVAGESYGVEENNKGGMFSEMIRLTCYSLPLPILIATPI